MLQPVFAPAPPNYDDPRNYGAKVDTWCCNDGTVNAGNFSQVSFTNQGWQSSALTIGNPICLRGLGTAGADLVTTIMSTQTILGVIYVNLASPAISAGTPGQVSAMFGTDDSAAINNCLLANGFLASASAHSSVPTIPGGSNSEGAWQQGPRTVLFSSRGRNSSIYGCLSPMRMTSGAKVEWQTYIGALPGFSGQALVHQIVDGGGVAIEIAKCQYIRPWLLCDRNCAVGLWIARQNDFRVDGQFYIFGATTAPFRVGDDTSPSGQRCIVGRVSDGGLIENFATNNFSTYNPNVTGCIGFNFANNVTDNSVTGDLFILGYQTGCRVSGGNNKIMANVHCWTGLNVGDMINAFEVDGGDNYIQRCFVDSPRSNTGAPIYGVLINGSCTIGEVVSTINPNVETADNTLTLIQNNYAGSGQVVIGNVIPGGSQSGPPIKLAAVVAGNLGNLVINNITQNTSYYTLGYTTPLQTETAARVAGDASLQAEVTAIQAVLPGQPWTPQQAQGQIGGWLDASVASTLTLSGSFVTGWNSRVGALDGVVAASSTAPTYSATGWAGSLPAVIFNGLVGGDCLDLGPPSHVAAGNDLSVFVVAKRGTQDTTDTTTRRDIVSMTSNNGASSYQGELSFLPPAQDGGQTEVRVGTAGSGSLQFTSFGIGVSGILVGIFASDYAPVGGQIGINAFILEGNTQTGGGGAALNSGSNSTHFSLGGGLAQGTSCRAAVTIAEVVIYSGAITQDLRQRTEGYLAWKWFGNGAGVLPTTHPYYNAPPLIAPAISSYIGLEVLLFSLPGANMNSTGVQNFILNPALVGNVNSFVIKCIRAVNKSSVNLTTAEGGIFTSMGSPPDTIVDATQTYTGLSAQNYGQDLTLTNAGDGVFSSLVPPYLLLTSPQGQAATADFYVFGVPLS